MDQFNCLASGKHVVEEGTEDIVESGIVYIFD